MNLLEEMYPQGEKVRGEYFRTLSILFELFSYSFASCYFQAETAWAFTVLGYLAKFILGILGLVFYWLNVI